MWEESAFIPYQAATRCPAGPALVLAPHPDDEVFGCGGAIMSHLAVGDEVSVIILTDSDYGCFAAECDRRAARRREATAAAAILGYGVPSFWGQPDRGLTYDEALIARLLAAVEDSAATLVYTPSWWEIHPDHCTLALAAVEAVRRCRRPLTLAMYEVGVPLHPNLLLDITGLSERKQAAMACFVSQLQVQRYDTQIMALNQFRTYTLPAGVRFAEAFRLMTQEELRRDPLRAIRPGIYYSQTVETAGLAPPLVSLLFIGTRAGLADALDSVMAQTYAHLEVVLVMDQRREMMEVMRDLTAWRGGRFSLVLVEVDEAVPFGERVNRGMEQAQGEWLLLLEDGDSLDANHISNLMATLKVSKTARCACAGVHRVWNQAGQGPKSDDWFLAPQPRGPEAYLSLPCNACIFARSLHEEGCRFDSELGKEMAKWDFWLQMSHRTQWLGCPSISASRRDMGYLSAEGSMWPPAAESAMTLVIGRWLNHVPSNEVASFIGEAMKRSEQAASEVNLWNARAVVLETRVQEVASALKTALHNNEAITLQMAEARRVIEETEALCLRLRQEIDSLHATRSWRWTNPLRVVVNWLRHACMAGRRFN